ncbi:HIT family protein [Rhizobium sp. RAF36]|jgi:diadenosine tetraphosphate (Ap4A) HIT family hydrolase|uniref:HIT family protein n=1 Tax=Rhizobium sp. RAF36 TaxID=3233055 RepID=UPI000DD535D4
MTSEHSIPPQYLIGQTPGWRVNHRINSALPGYVIISSIADTNSLADLPAEALASMGTVFAKVQHALSDVLGAERVYIGRYGHSPGYPIHFHAIPIYRWVEELFWKDDRYRMLERFSHGPGETPTDGAELTLFVWREFCERPDPPPVKGPSVTESISMLRQAIQF